MSRHGGKPEVAEIPSRRRERPAADMPFLVLLVSHERDCGASTDWYQSSPTERSMNLRVIFAGFAIATFGLFMVTFNALGQQQPLKDHLVGTWTLLSWEQKKGDGTKVERYGTSPKGIAFFDAGGRYIITVMRSDRAKYASNALWQGHPRGKQRNSRRHDNLLRNIFR